MGAQDSFCAKRGSVKNFTLDRYDFDTLMLALAIAAAASGQRHIGYMHRFIGLADALNLQNPEWNPNRLNDETPQEEMPKH
jgi:hypothetical protein